MAEKENQTQETAEQPKKTAKGKTLRVRSTQEQPNGNGSWNQAFYERDEAHPEGEVWIADGEIHEVGDTPKVRLAIANKKLVEA